MKLAADRRDAAIKIAAIGARTPLVPVAWLLLVMSRNVTLFAMSRECSNVPEEEPDTYTTMSEQVRDSD
jgi:hypothetical protein